MKGELMKGKMKIYMYIKLFVSLCNLDLALHKKSAGRLSSCTDPNEGKLIHLTYHLQYPQPWWLEGV